MPTPITRVVVLMMENHSFDRVLGWMKNDYPKIEGVDPDRPGWNPDYPVTTDTVFQTQTRNRNIANDPGHDLDNVLGQLVGGNRAWWPIPPKRILVESVQCFDTAEQTDAFVRLPLMAG
jgi:phospholipase C